MLHNIRAISTKFSISCRGQAAKKVSSVSCVQLHSRRGRNNKSEQRYSLIVAGVGENGSWTGGERGRTGVALLPRAIIGRRTPESARIDAGSDPFSQMLSL
jgi:hypothetical protein